jgi:iron complex outermembrane receptor protein
MGYRTSGDETHPSTLLFFDPASRRLGLFNVFAQDEIAIRDDRLHLILGSKFENYTYSGWSAQPTARLVWTPDARQTLWGGVSRAVRLPTRFDDDLRILAANGAVLIRGSSTFHPESLVAYEVGYGVLPDPHISLDIDLYYNDYDDLRSQESPPTVIPISLANRLRGRTYGAEISTRVQIQPWWRVSAWYSNLQKNLDFEPGSTDRSLGLQEGADPRNQVSLRSSMDLPHKTEFDFWLRHVSALEQPSPPPVPAYTVFDVRAGWRPIEAFEIAVVGRNLPHRRHQEFGPFGELVRRSVYVTATWRF